MTLHSKKKKFIQYIKNNLKLFLYRLNLLFNFKKEKKTEIIYIIEKENWSIKWDGEYISNKINQQEKSKIISTNEIPSINPRNKLIHFGSQYMWIDWYKLFTISAVSGVDPDVTFLIFVRVFILSPGLTRSGE